MQRWLICCVLVFLAGPVLAQDQTDRPNIVLILADDVGYGDLSCYGATRVSTPNLDQLAQEGLLLTDAHSAAATCTPSRYALLTGEYAWRQKGTGIAAGDAKLIIEPGRLTLASLLKQAGYKTGVVGKWHLGLGDGRLNWNDEIRPGPLELGFDYCFLIPATGDRVPCVYVENRRVVDLDPNDPIEVSYRGPLGDEPTGASHPELLKMRPSHGHNQTIVNGISRIGYMRGGKAAQWVDEDMADRITEKAVKFIEEHREDPFFLFFSTHDIHVPRVPHARFVGQTAMGPRGDVIAQLDWCVGQILQTLRQHHLTKNTIVMFTSDNGPVVDDGYRDDAVEKLGDHRPAGPWRGGKYSNFEGGTRVPWIVSWPGRVPTGQSRALVCQVDLVASFAAFTGQEFDKSTAPDSQNVMSALLGDDAVGRDHLVEQARTQSLRQGEWKYIPPNPGARINRSTNTELGSDASPQLYQLEQDPAESTNVAAEQRAIVEQLDAQLKSIRQPGR